MFDTNVDILVLDQFQVGRKLDVTAFLDTRIACSAAEAIVVIPCRYGRETILPLPGQPIMIFDADRSTLLRTRGQAQQRGRTCAAHVEAMFTTGHDAANRKALLTDPADEPDLVGIAGRGPNEEAEKAIKVAKSHP